VDIPAKGEWMWADLQRWAARQGVPIHRHEPFPVNTLLLMRGAVVAERDGTLEPYADAVWKAFWQEGARLDAPETLLPVIEAAGLDAGRFAEGVQDPAIKEALKEKSEAAVARGVFGVPTCFVDDTLFWGNDRLDFVEEAAAA
jgi:2-hydroxychromene-2-carboxylate isomerase